MTTPFILTVNGTGDPDPTDTTGFSGMLGSMVGGVNPWQIVADKLDGIETPEPPYIWQPIGYPAAVMPMRPSFMNAVSQLDAALGVDPDTLDWYGGPVYQGLVFSSGKGVLSGYSQGSCATNYVWQQHIYPEDGILHNRIDDILSVVNFGDVFRTPSVANGCTYQGIPVPPEQDGAATGGIGGPLDLTVDETNYPNVLGKPVVMSWCLPKDLYGSSPVGLNPWTDEASAGFVGTSIMNFIFNESFTSFVEIAEDLGHPIGMVEEIYNGLVFAIGSVQIGANGYPVAPHWQYSNEGCVASAAQYLTELANSL